MIETRRLKNVIIFIQKITFRFAKSSHALTSQQHICFIEYRLHHRRKNEKQMYRPFVEGKELGQLRVEDRGPRKQIP